MYIHVTPLRIHHTCTLHMYTAQGERGMGKTEVALRACHYVRERHAFDRIIFAACATTTAAAAAATAAAARQPEALERAFCTRLGKLLGASTQKPCKDARALLRLIRPRTSSSSSSASSNGSSGITTGSSSSNAAVDTDKLTADGTGWVKRGAKSDAPVQSEQQVYIPQDINVYR
jgi:hypothetical protein